MMLQVLMMWKSCQVSKEDNERDLKRLQREIQDSNTKGKGRFSPLDIILWRTLQSRSGS